MNEQIYVSEKLQQLDRERPHRTPDPRDPKREPRRPFAPVVRAAGRRVRRLGEALESWATPATRARHM